MRLPRATFIEHFGIALDIHCLRRWPRRGGPPLHLSTCIHDWICTAAGTVSADRAAFVAAVEPVIAALHAGLPPGQRPARDTALGAVYDALDAAGIEVAVQAPAPRHF